MKNYLKVIALLGLTLIFSTSIKGQISEEDSSYIQFSGLVLTSDSIYPIPYVVVSSQGEGIYTDFNGFFSFAAKKGDTITFSHVNYKQVDFVIPDTLTGYKYNVVQLMTQDTVYMQVTIVRPLPGRRVFDYVFVNKEIPDDKIERARKNLEKDAIKQQASKMDPSSSENFRNAMHNESKKMYYAGQLPPNNLLNPFAWAEFFKAWERGDFKKKTSKSRK